MTAAIAADEIPADDGIVTWLVLVYQMPPKAEGLAARVRRTLSKAGAVYLAPACAAVPVSRRAETAMRQMRSAIAGGGGSAVLLSGQALSGGQDLTGAFNGERDHVYEAIIDSCRDAVAEIEEMIAARDFRYVQLWRKDTELRQVVKHHQAQRGRDWFGARQGEAAATAVASYRSALDDYAKRVYTAGG